VSNWLDTACSRFGLFKHRHGVIGEGDLACFAGVASDLVEASVPYGRARATLTSPPISSASCVMRRSAIRLSLMRRG